MRQHHLEINTPGRGTIEISDKIDATIANSQINTGLCHVFLQHTSASLILCENYDPDVRADLETFTSNFAKDGDKMFSHTAEGPDDMAAHIRTIYTHNDLTIPITNGKLTLGTWQGVFLWEHRHHPHRRQVIISLIPLD